MNETFAKVIAFLQNSGRFISPCDVVIYHSLNKFTITIIYFHYNSFIYTLACLFVFAYLLTFKFM